VEREYSPDRMVADLESELLAVAERAARAVPAHGAQ